MMALSNEEVRTFFFEGLPTTTGATDAELRAAEEQLDHKLPDGFKQLLRLRKCGGQPVRPCSAALGTTWAKDHVHLGDLMGIVDSRWTPSIFSSRTWIDEWEYPAIGVAIGFCPSAGHDLVWLDYSTCGRQGEPRVVHVDQENDMRITLLAENFVSFVRGLKTEEVETALES
mmetsp:Transcript_7995/g.18371  ORF Transcript_7995/g.18371 Transcript_7995/m.18371 type:complete len:172 (+) Transcript_7995:46-561(+)